MEQGESAASFGGKQSQEDQQVADIGFHLKVIEPFSISLHSLGLLRSHRSKLMLWEAKKGGKFAVAADMCLGGCPNPSKIEQCVKSTFLNLYTHGKTK